MNREKIVLWSNVFFLIPLAIAVAYHLYLYSAVIVIALLASSKFHLQPKPHWRVLDRFAALVLIASNLYLFKLTSFSSWWFVAAISLALVAFVFFFKASKHEYYHNHALWHFFSAMITICSVLGYINY